MRAQATNNPEVATPFEEYLDGSRARINMVVERGQKESRGTWHVAVHKRLLGAGNLRRKRMSRSAGTKPAKEEAGFEEWEGGGGWGGEST